MIEEVTHSDPLYLITGATGFIGRRVCEMIAEDGYRLRGFAIARDSTLPLTDWFVGDLTNPEDCCHAMSGVSIVIHLAGEKRNVSRMWPVNVEGTRNLLAAAEAEGVRRFIHVSSVGVIGADPLASGLFGEDAQCHPRNDYERSKWEAEALVEQAMTRGLAATILRPANVFGDRDPSQGLLTLARNVSKGRFIYLGGRAALCNYVFVEDVAHALLLLAEHSDAVGHTYHLSDTCTVGEFVNTLADDLDVAKPGRGVPDFIAPGVRASLRIGERALHLSRFATFARVLTLNNQISFASSRLTDELGFSYRVGWREGLRRVVQWYRAQGML